MGAGIGIAPIRALLEGLEADPGDITVIYRTRRADRAVLHNELGALAHRRGAGYVTVDGHRNTERASWLPAHAANWGDAQALRHLCPDIAERDVYICGPPEWMAAVRSAARQAGAAPDSLHCEYFEI